jgi:hypothetical protein
MVFFSEEKDGKKDDIDISDTGVILLTWARLPF